MSSPPGPVHTRETDAQPRMPAADSLAGLLPVRPASESAWRDSPRQLQQHAKLAQLQAATPTPAAPAAPDGGLPVGLRQGVEALSGVDMSGVRVHRNSSKPATLQAHAYAQGQDIFLGPGQEKHLPHEAWHVVQQAKGRVRPTVDVQGVAVNADPALEREADRMGARALSGGGAAASLSAAGASRPDTGISTGAVAQRVVGTYQPGTLAYTTKAMRDLSSSQMLTVQQLHDDPWHTYTVDEARAIAQGLHTVSASNPYTWDVTGIGSYATSDPGVQSILQSFGHPTQSVVKTYDDLAGLVSHDVGKGRKGLLSPGTVGELHSMFEASTPLHMDFNPFLHDAWTGNLEDYGGAKKNIPLYSVMRSQLTGDFRAHDLGTVTLNDVLREVSSRPAEVHHLAYKAHYPDLANHTGNLMLAERSERESVAGPGQHELMHMVFSGKHPDKFNALLPQVVETYDDWLAGKKGSGIL